MPIDERTRLDLRQWFTEHMNTEMANAIMEAMPPVDFGDLATGRNLSDQGVALRRNIADHGVALQKEMVELRSELRCEMAELRNELRGEMQELRHDIDIKLERAFAKQLKWLVATQFASVAVLGGVIGLVAGLS